MTFTRKGKETDTRADKQINWQNFRKTKKDRTIDTDIQKREDK